MANGYHTFIGQWILCHGAARLHFRGKLVAVEHGSTETRLYMHPCITVYRWDEHCNPPTFEVARETTEEMPGILTAEHFSFVGLQHNKWPLHVIPHTHDLGPDTEATQ